MLSKRNGHPFEVVATEAEMPLPLAAGDIKAVALDNPDARMLTPEGIGGLILSAPA